ncbi:MAG TPA: SpoIID/LytB domain-containing protein [Actinomycetota bacterium]
MRRLPRRGAALTLGVVVALALLPAPAADASGAASSITVWGRGFGHGRGLSQWGARGLASTGSSWQAILAHYYRGTALARRPPGERIRVLVESSPAVVATSARRFTIRWRDGRMIGLNDSSRRFVRVRYAGGRYRVDKGTTPWGPWRAMTHGKMPVVFVRGASPIEIVSSSGSSRAYRQTIEVRRRGSRIDAINHVPLEEYLMGVVPREMPSTWPANALRAQAVAARSYAVAVMERWRDRSYHICDTTACQVYGGLATRRAQGSKPVTAERGSTTAAVLGTARLVVTHAGRTVLAEYSSSSGGRTANGGRPYLRSVDDPSDRISPHHRWSVRLDSGRIEREWPSVGRLRSVVVRGRDGGGPWGGRVRSVRITGTRGRVDVPGGTFASRMNLRSRLYAIAPPPAAGYRFTTDMGIGATGRAVRELQHRLHRAGAYPAGKVTGTFGPLTRDALRRYQRSRGIRPTGYLGPQTRAKLNAEAR